MKTCIKGFPTPSSLLRERERDGANQLNKNKRLNKTKVKTYKNSKFGILIGGGIFRDVKLTHKP